MGLAEDIARRNNKKLLDDINIRSPGSIEELRELPKDYNIESNQIFGQLTTIKKVNNWDWNCMCNCGEHIIVSATNLASGKTTSCKPCKINSLPSIDVGYQIYHLTAKKKITEKMWLWRCDCGNEIILPLIKIFNSVVNRSCGCMWKADMAQRRKERRSRPTR